MVGGLWKETQAAAKRVAQVWGAVAAVSNGGVLVYVASLRAGGIRRDEQDQETAGEEEGADQD